MASEGQATVKLTVRDGFAECQLQHSSPCTSPPRSPQRVVVGPALRKQPQPSKRVQFAGGSQHCDSFGSGGQAEQQDWDGEDRCTYAQQRSPSPACTQPAAAAALAPAPVPVATSPGWPGSEQLMAHAKPLAAISGYQHMMQQHSPCFPPCSQRQVTSQQPHPAHPHDRVPAFHTAAAGPQPQQPFQHWGLNAEANRLSQEQHCTQQPAGTAGDTAGAVGQPSQGCPPACSTHHVHVHAGTVSLNPSDKTQLVGAVLEELRQQWHNAASQEQLPLPSACSAAPAAVCAETQTDAPEPAALAPLTDAQLPATTSSQPQALPPSLRLLVPSRQPSPAHCSSDVAAPHLGAAVADSRAVQLSAAMAASARPASQEEAADYSTAEDGEEDEEGLLHILAGAGGLHGSGTGRSRSKGSRALHQSWGHADALQALANGTAAFGQAHTRGRLGGRLSATDALPARLAAQQLGSLAGASLRVQRAILHSQRVFERQAGMVEQAVLARAFYAWQRLHTAHQEKRHAALAARRQVGMGQLRRCLHAWRQRCCPTSQQQQALQRAAALLQRGMLRRCWQEWQRLCSLRWWKLQVELRDQQIRVLGTALRHLEARPVQYMQKQRLRAWLAGWRQAAERQQAKRAMWARAVRHSKRTVLLAALVAWQGAAASKAAERRRLCQAQRLLDHQRLHHAWVGWCSLVGSRAARKQKAAAAQQHWQQRVLRRALAGWRFAAWFHRTARKAQQRRQQAVVCVAFGFWRRQAAVAVAREALLVAVGHEGKRKLAARAFCGWQAYLEGMQGQRQQQELDRLVEQASLLERENKQLKQEHERRCGVIDSGDWGRQRVQELLQAGQVLQEERDALARLVAGLQAAGQGDRPASALQGGRVAMSTTLPLTLPLPAAAALHDATNSPEAGLQGFAAAGGGSCGSRRQQEGQHAQRYRICAATGVIQPDASSGEGGAVGLAGYTCQPAVSPGPGQAATPLAAAAATSAGAAAGAGSAAARNKLLVRSGSSFNALVRALKQDLVASSSLQRQPVAAAFEVDKLSLNRVSVAAADGGLSIEAVASPDTRGVVFGRTYPPSPLRQQAVQPTATSGQGRGRGQERNRGQGQRDRSSGSSSLLAAALRLQGIGGRSVGLNKSMN